MWPAYPSGVHALPVSVWGLARGNPLDPRFRFATIIILMNKKITGGTDGKKK